MSQSVKTLLHAAVGFMALLAAYQLLLVANGQWWFTDPTSPRLLMLAIVYGLVSGAVELVARVERSPWRFASMRDAFKLLRSTTVTALLFLLILFILNRAETLPRSVLVLTWMIQLGVLGGSRLVRRAIYEGALTTMLAAVGVRSNETPRSSLLVVGAVDDAEAALRDLDRDTQRKWRPTGVVTLHSDDRGKLIRNVPVAASLEGWDTLIAALIRADRQPDAILFLIDPADLLTTEQLGVLTTRSIKLLRRPRISELTENDSSRSVREIGIEELLSRPPVRLDMQAVRRLVEGKRVLVTGAGGSIGSEICRQVASLGCKHLTALDHSEFSLFNIDREIGDSFPHLSRKDVLCNVRDGDRIADWFLSERPEVVFHAAALKHVPLVESHPDQGFLTNVVGTHNVAAAAAACVSTDMVLISTDKAVAPSNVMGATKRLAEAVVRGARTHGSTRYTVVRFGNVLGSAGSVVPIFKDQIARGGPVTVTHEDVERYFMTIPEAVQLVLHAAASSGATEEVDGGIHVLNMGKPVRVHDLAEKMISLSGKRVGVDIGIEIVGLRAGEKLTEELVDETEIVVSEEASVIRVKDRHQAKGISLKEIRSVQAMAEKGEHAAVRDAVYRLTDKVRLGAEKTS